MKENELLDKINKSVQEKIIANAVDVTDKFKKGQKELIGRIRLFFENLNEECNIDELKIYLEKVFLFRNGSLKGHLAGQSGNYILLSDRLLREPDHVKIFTVTHEIVHFLTGNKKSKINNGIYQRTGYGIQHLDYQDESNEVITKKSFFEWFNDGMTDYITILILGEEFVVCLERDQVHQRLYKMIRFLIEDVSEQINEEEVIKDYINRGSKFLQAIHKKHGKYSITILSQIDEYNLDDSMEFFQTSNLKKKEELRKKLVIK